MSPRPKIDEIRNATSFSTKVIIAALFTVLNFYMLLANYPNLITAIVHTFYGIYYIVHNLCNAGIVFYSIYVVGRLIYLFLLDDHQRPCTRRYLCCLLSCGGFCVLYMTMQGYSGFAVLGLVCFGYLSIRVDREKKTRGRRGLNGLR
ncbi:hypothetical protein NX059_011388 [Plenodomus lindquistii]|nr:hypothetical protein NX059_011388 [Plenodomus lindquistii]